MPLFSYIYWRSNCWQLRPYLHVSRWQLTVILAWPLDFNMPMVHVPHGPASSRGLNHYRSDVYMRWMSRALYPKQHAHHSRSLFSFCWHSDGSKPCLCTQGLLRGTLYSRIFTGESTQQSSWIIATVYNIGYENTTMHQQLQIEPVAMKLPYISFKLPAVIFCRGVSGLVTVYLWGVGCVFVCVCIFGSAHARCMLVHFLVNLF